MTHPRSLSLARTSLLAILAAFLLSIVGAAPAAAAPAIGLTATTTNFGYVPVGTVVDSTVTLTNTGDATLTNLSVTFMTSSQQMTVIPPSTPPNPSADLPAGQSRAFTVRYAPTTRTSASLQFRVASSALPASATKQLYFGGAGAGAVLTAPSNQFVGMANIGATTTNTLTIRNQGELPLVVTGATLTGANAADFSVDASAATASPIPPNGTRTITISLTPSAAGYRNASLQIASNSVPAASAIPIYGQGF